MNAQKTYHVKKSTDEIKTKKRKIVYLVIPRLCSVFPMRRLCNFWFHSLPE